MNDDCQWEVKIRVYFTEELEDNLSCFTYSEEIVTFHEGEESAQRFIKDFSAEAAEEFIERNVS